METAAHAVAGARFGNAQRGITRPLCRWWVCLGLGQIRHLINVKRFFQVTGIFLLLFMLQVGVYSFHEFSEAGLLPNSEVLHAATEKFSPDGLYGKWFSVVMVSVCALWLMGGWLKDRLKLTRQNTVNLGEV